MSHDLQFNVQNGDGTLQSSNEVPVRGEMDHLPDHSAAGIVGAGGVGAPAGAASGGGGGGAGAGGSLQYISDKLQQSAHPTVAIFHVLFKLAALVLYIFGGIFVGRRNSESGARFITLTVFCILLLAADFWVVKNVTGRLLVGLRWWNKVENDSTKWIFESAEDKVVNPFDKSWFWTVLYSTPAVWTALFILGLLKFELNWLLIVVIALSLSMANVYGYYKCSSDQKARFEHMVQQGAQQGAMTLVRSSVLSMITGTNSPAAGGNNRSNTYV